MDRLNLDQRKLIEHLEQIEEAGEMVLAKQQQCVVYDKCRQKSREAIRHLRKASDNKDTVWACLSNQFFRLPREGLHKTLEQDIKVYDMEIQKLRDQLKEDVNWLYELEGKEKLKGFDLTALSRND